MRICVYGAASTKIDKKYLNKLFAIAKDAVWEADAPNYFQNNLP